MREVHRRPGGGAVGVAGREIRRVFAARVGLDTVVRETYRGTGLFVVRPGQGRPDGRGRVRVRGRHRSGHRCGATRPARGAGRPAHGGSHARRCVGAHGARVNQGGAGGRGQRRLRRGHHRNPEILRKTLGDNRNRGTAADGGQGGQDTGRNLVALQGFLDDGEQPRQGRFEQSLQLRAGDAQSRREAGQVGVDRRRGLGRQPLLGLPALVAQLGQRADRRRTGRVGVGRLGDAGDDVVQQRLIHQVTGELWVAHGLADLAQGRGVGDGDAGAAATEIAERHHTVIGQPGPGLEAGQGCGRVGDHRCGRQAGLAAQRRGECADGGHAPVRGRGDDDRGAAARGAGHGVEGLGQDGFTAMRRAVRGDQRDRVADPLHEPGQHQAAGLRGDADFSGPIRVQGQDGATAHRRSPGRHRHQVGLADRQTEPVAHEVHSFDALSNCGHPMRWRPGGGTQSPNDW